MSVAVLDTTPRPRSSASQESAGRPAEGGGNGLLPLHILLFAQSTAATERRSGIHRVTVELARRLSGVAPVDFVKWDTTQGQLGYFDRRDLESLFRARTLPAGVRVNPYAGRVNDRFSATLDPGKRYWLVFPEIAYHLPDGNETFARVISQCRDYGVRVASVFYDLIPVTNPHYQTYRPPHLRYSIDLARSDLIVPISHHVGTVLADFYAQGGVDADGVTARIRAVPLPEGERVALPAPEDGQRDTVLMVGTVEPRKRQVEVLKAFNQAAAADPAVARLKVVVIGSLHPDSALEFHRQVDANPNITYCDYSSEAFIQDCYQRALFTVFASNDEGYGLPIAESVARGVPCLTANFGSMAEIAEGGGCLTVNVEDQEALTAGIRRLAGDAALRERLCAEIAERRLRTWGDYAADVVRLIEDTDARAQQALAAVRPPEAEPAAGVRVREATVGTTPVRFVSLPRALDAAALLPSAESAGLTGAAFPGSAEELRALPAAARALLYAADAAAFRSEEAYRAFVEAAREDGWPRLLPTRIVRDADAEAMEAGLCRALQELAGRRAERMRWADDERVLMGLARRWQAESEAPAARLSIVISTYNRAAFVCENARWVLEAIAPYGPEVRLVVVDNASTDDSWARLQQFAGNPQCTLHRNSANTGMLGNLRVCSMLRGSRHVWVTGDDDYIMPETLAEVLRVLREEPALPLGVVNFGVYHRAAFSPMDSADIFVRERQPLAPEPMPSGLYPVSKAAGEHDNLFTAVYAIIFRSDILAACFNHPFTGVPFIDLVESVPTTRIILDNYRHTPAWWFAPIGIVGNAHNSWTRHRMRWHALLMPMVFELAREAGMDGEKLYGWSRIHRELFREAAGIALERDIPAHLDLPGDLEVGERVFREPIEVPAGIRLERPESGW
ncbi:glycosyltransferase [Azospirillum sp. TSO22-1]|uniref:glycosyltransferase n=1 Tax=Azospirillum sp. TSO22-1 TaxID=716789 RepID=UPI000D610743|nr:glycosyltransferase [Azospirillum sp. TSO22-1]PWC55359.1 hypothetical protein TSO221_05420 [Azospirillum sp. TSO22-1]